MQPYTFCFINVDIEYLHLDLEICLFNASWKFLQYLTLVNVTNHEWFYNTQFVHALLWY